MALSIIHFPHPTLRHRSRPIARVDAKLHAMAAEMLDLMYENEGVGLAANQVDLPIRMFVANASGVRGEGQEWVVINPVIDRPKGSEAGQEGCLSVPGLFAQVKRPKTVRLQGYDLKGQEINQELDGFLSRVVQHEVDHLDGVMFFDRIGNEAMRDLEHGLAEFETTFQSLRNTGSIPDDAELAKRLAHWEKTYT
ncbi:MULTISPECIES: peptide deformylase [Pirellulaceae]|uniref:Peptide deformylase n=1 Tax=Aporhodopirellula rubra TaxID=980271 RepID=A0A7W5H4D0_9BACT|nr:MULTISPECIES: peptide deformylase [Pirellulaceae]EMI44790.1 peptide deformylase [Rhodopirellula sp. SWK7]MBB3205224.1 peptide deformylase [Aporhodopirellula rubra]